MSSPEHAAAAPAVLTAAPTEARLAASHAEVSGAEARALAHAELRDWFEERAADVDEGRAGVRDGVVLLGRHGLADTDLEGVADLIALVARSDLASAFSAWAHRMVLGYVALAPRQASVSELLPALRSGDLMGSTALASGTAHHLAGAPLTVRYRHEAGHLRLDGTIAWASNLLPPFLCVTAAVDSEDPERTVVIAFRDDDPGLTLVPYPRLLALQSTGSSSVHLDDLRLPADRIISHDLADFLGRALPPFLVLQSAFCRGLAGRALDEAEAKLGPLAESVRGDLDRARDAWQDAERRARELARRATSDPTGVPLRDLLELRLESARIAGEAVRLELVLAGGRGYLGGSATARRLREAAFLPVQAPTEVLLRWILARSA